jgi:hypothetical protein
LATGATPAAKPTSAALSLKNFLRPDNFGLTGAPSQ